MSKNFGQRKILYFNIVLFLIVALWQFLQPFMSDDYWIASFDVVAKHTVIANITTQYYINTGRIFAEWLKFVFESKSYLFIFYPIIRLLGALTVVISVNLIYQYLFGKEYKFRRYYFITSGFIIFYIACGYFAQDFIWYTVSMQYAWGFCLTLFIGLIFIDNYKNQAPANRSLLLLYALFGFLIGIYNEIYIALLFDVFITAIIITIIFKLELKKLLLPQYFTILISSLCGFIVLFLAPGNFVRRAKFIANNPSTAHDSIFTKILMTYDRFFRYGYHIIAAVIILGFVIYCYKNKHKYKLADVIFITFLIILLNIHILSFFEIAYYSPIAGRMNIFIDAIIYLIIAKFIIITVLPIKYTNMRRITIFWIVITTIVVAWTTYAFINVHNFYEKRYALIKKDKALGLTDLVLPPYCANLLVKWPVYLEDVTPYKDRLANFGLADYFEVHSIVVESKACN